MADTYNMSGISDQVQRVFHLITTHLGTTFFLQQLILLTASSRGKPLRFEEEKIPVSISGSCIALQDVDLITTRIGMDPILTQATQLHEMAHLLLRHIPLLSDGPTTPAYTTFRHNLSQQHIMYRMGSYDDDREQDAELLATLLFGCITRKSTSLPEIAKDVYGW